MQRTFVLLVFSILSVHFLFGQSTFQRTYDTELFTAGYSVVNADEGGYVMALNEQVTFGSDYRLTLIKTDEFGEVNWSRQFLPMSPFSNPSVIAPNDGGLMVVAEQGSPPALVALRLDGNGDTLWTRSYPTLGAAMMPVVVESYDGGYVISGRTLNSHMISKIDESGSVLWSSKYNADTSPEGTAFDFKGDIIQTTDSGFISVGLGYVDGILNSNGLVIKVDKDGVLEWSSVLGGDDEDCFRSVNELQDGTILICGYTKSFGEGEQNILLVSLSSAGEVNWTRTLGSELNDNIYTATQIPGGGILITGNIRDLDNLPIKGLIVKLDNNANLSLAKEIDNPLRIFDATISSDFGLVFTGSLGQIDGTLSSALVKADTTGFAGCNTLNMDMTVLEHEIQTSENIMLEEGLTESILTIEIVDVDLTSELVCDSIVSGIEDFQKESELHVFPNPANGVVNFYMQSERMIKGYITVMNNQGAIIYRSDIRNDNLIEMDCSTWSPGVYVYQFIGDNSSTDQGRLIVE